MADFACRPLNNRINEHYSLDMMKTLLLVAVGFLFLTSCASVLTRDAMETGIRDFSFADLMRNPDLYQGKLFVLGGIIVDTTVTQQGSRIEALYVPVDSRGYLKDSSGLTIRFRALFPKDRGILDPMIYRKNRQITVAATFAGMEPGKIDQMDYMFPAFRIQEIYLWEERQPVAYAPYPYAPYPYWGSPWPYRSWGYYYPYW